MLVLLKHHGGALGDNLKRLYRLRELHGMPRPDVAVADERETARRVKVFHNFLIKTYRGESSTSDFFLAARLVVRYRVGGERGGAVYTCCTRAQERGRRTH